MSSANYKDIANKIKFEGRAFINGKYVDAIDGEKFETINPAKSDERFAISATTTTTMAVIKVLITKYNICYLFFPSICIIARSIVF